MDEDVLAALGSKDMTQEKLIATVSPEIRNQGEVRMASFRLKSQAK